MIWDVLPFVLSGMTALGMHIIGKKDRRGWLVGLANQVIWVAFIIHTQSWGLLILTVILTKIYLSSYLKWSMEDWIRAEDDRLRHERDLYEREMADLSDLENGFCRA